MNDARPLRIAPPSALTLSFMAMTSPLFVYAFDKKRFLPSGSKHVRLPLPACQYGGKFRRETGRCQPVEEAKGAKRFQKVRVYGWLASRNKQPALAAIRKTLGTQPPPPPPEDETAPERMLQLTGIDFTCCPVCGKVNLTGCVASHTIPV